MTRTRALACALLTAALAACADPGPEPTLGRTPDPLTFTAVVIEPDPAPPTGGTEITQPGPGGLPPAPLDLAARPTHPWTERPVVYRRHVVGATSAGYSAAWNTARDLGYHPAVLNAHADLPLGARRYTGVWHKDDRVLDWTSRRDMTEATYVETWNTHDADGYRVIDLDAHVQNGEPRYHAIWVRETSPRAYKSHRRLTRAQLDAKIAEYRADGYRPTRINAWSGDRGVLLYTAVWTRDGNTDFVYDPAMTPAEYAATWSALRDDGYVPIDIGPYRQGPAERFTGIWLRDEGIDGWASTRDQSAEDIEELNETYTKTNLVLVDLDGYIDAQGTPRYTAIWHRTEPRRRIVSSHPTAGDPDITTLRALIDEYETSGLDNRRGTVGVWVADLVTGDHVAYNLHEPFYLASTSKVLIGARAVALPGFDPAATTPFTSTMWRGEDSRGFTEAIIGSDVSNQTFMTNMIQQSDSASTDHFHRLITTAEGPRGLDDWLHDAADLQNVGEITTICEVDKRIWTRTAPCVAQVSCDTFEAFIRDGGTLWNATDAEETCLQGMVDAGSLEDHEGYYTTLDNTITPAEFGHFWHKLAAGDLMSDLDRAELLRALDLGGNSGFNIGQGVQYDQFGTKNGGKRRVSTQVGIMWDWAGAPGDHSDVIPRYAFALFTEDWSFETSADADLDGVQDDTQWARAVMTDVLARALAFLQSN